MIDRPGCGCQPSRRVWEAVVPVVLEIRPEFKLLCSRFLGVLTHEDLIGLSAAIRDSPGFRPEFSVIHDARKLQEDRVPFATMMSIAGGISTFRNQIAVPTTIGIITPDDVPFGMGRMFQSLLSSCAYVRVVVERDCEEVLDALSLEEPAKHFVRAG